MKITVKTDLFDVAENLQQAAVKQMPFAMARALTKTARDCVEPAKQEMGRVFELRAKWVQKGMRVTRALKKDYPNTKAVVWHKDYYMHHQMHGSVEEGRRRTYITKEGKVMATHEAVPMVGRGKPRTSESTPTRPSRWPGGSRWWQTKKQKLKPRLYHAQLKSGAVGLFKAPTSKQIARNRKRNAKLAKGERDERNVKAKLLWVFPKKIEIKPRWDLFEVVSQTVDDVWEKNIFDSLRLALETQKKPKMRKL